MTKLEQADEIDWIETNKALAKEIIELKKQAEQDPVGYFAYDEEHDIWEELTGPNAPGATPLYTAPQPVEQEPVAWMRLNEKSECEAIEYIGNVDEHLYLPPSCQWLYTSPVLTMQQVEPKPVAKVGHLHQSIVEACGLPMSTPLYAAPVRTKDLTDDELRQVLDRNCGDGLMAIARAVIAADREKNK